MGAYKRVLVIGALLALVWFVRFCWRPGTSSVAPPPPSNRADRLLMGSAVMLPVGGGKGTGYTIYHGWGSLEGPSAFAIANVVGVENPTDNACPVRLVIDGHLGSDCPTSPDAYIELRPGEATQDVGRLFGGAIPKNPCELVACVPVEAAATVKKLTLKVVFRLGS